MSRFLKIGILRSHAQLFKKRDTVKAEKFRGISLLDTSYKVLSLVILRILETYATNIIEQY